MRKVLVPILGLILLGCGSEGGTTATVPLETPPAPSTSTAPAPSTGGLAEAEGFPVNVETTSGPVTLEDRPERIVSLSPTLTEMLFAVGAGPQVVAVDEYSTHPEEAPVTDLSGYTPNLEAIASYQPDLVVVSDDIDGLVGALGELEIPVAHLPAAEDLEDVHRQIEQIGALTGRGREAARVVEEMRDEVEEILASTPIPSRPLTYFHELDPGLYTATSDTFLGRVYSLFGLENVADPADPDGSGYPQLSAEYLLQADPDIVFLADADCCGVTRETVAQRPGWAEMTAVETGAVFEMDEDIASRWGPRIVEYVAAVSAAVEQVGER